MRWPEAIPLVDIKSETVADAFFSGWIARLGTPATITMDREAQFDSQLRNNLCKHHQKSYNELPPSVEWQGRTFSLAAECRHYGTRVAKPVDNYVASILLGIRSALKEFLGRSAVEMPGELTESYTIDAHTDLDDYSDKLCVPL